MGVHHRRSAGLSLFAVALLGALLVGVVSPPEAAAGPADEKLSRAIDLTLRDADLPAAVKGFVAASGIAVVAKGHAPSPKWSLSVRGIPALDVLDALAGAYHAQWRWEGTTVVIRRDPLDREIDLSLEDATLSAATAALSRVAGLSVRSEGKAPTRKVTLSLEKVPVRRALDVVSAIFGLRWYTQGRSILIASGAGREGGGVPEQFIGALNEALGQEWGQEDTRLPALGQQLMHSLKGRLMDALKPGEIVDLEQLTTDEQSAAYEIVRRRLVGDVMRAFRDPQRPSIDLAAAGGSGLAVRLSPDGRQLDLIVPRTDGLRHPLLSITKDGGPAERSPPVK